MKKKDVQIGHVYAAKVSGRVVPVRLIRESQYGGGWIATNTKTNRDVLIKTAARLRYKIKHEEMKP